MRALLIALALMGQHLPHGAGHGRVGRGGGFSGSFASGSGSGVVLADDGPTLSAGIAGTASMGTYTLPNKTLYLPNGITLGSSASNKTIQGAANSAIVLGQPVTGWTAMASTDAHYNDIPSGSRSSILVASAPFLATLGAGPTAELYMGSSVQSQAVWPSPGGGTYNDGWQSITAAGSFGGIGGTQGLTHAPDSTPTSWNAVRFGSIICEGWPYDGAYAYGRLGAVTNSSTTIIGYQGYYKGFGAGPSGFRNNRIRYRNVLEELLSPGQYWIDPITYRIYWYPPAGWNGSQSTYVSAPGTINIAGATSLTIEGSSSSNALPIIGSQGNAVVVSNSSHVELQYCQIAGPGGYGVYAADFLSTYLTLDNCDVLDCGKGGFYIAGGNRLTRVASHNTVSNSVFERWGRLIQDIPNGMVGMSPTVSTDYFYNSSAAAIVLGTPYVGAPNLQIDGANDALISGCLVDQVCKGMADYGAIYFGLNWGALGNVVTNTTVENCAPYEGSGSGWTLWGFYLDDAQAGATISHCTARTVSTDSQGNASTAVQFGGVIMGGGWGNTITDLHLDGVGTYGLGIDDRDSPSGFARSNALTTGANYKSVSQWMTWGGTEPSGWSAAYDNLDGSGHGLASWMGLYVAGTPASTYGYPLYDTIGAVSYTNQASQLFENLDNYMSANSGWSFGSGLVTLSASSVTNTSSGGAPTYTGRTSPAAVSGGS